LLAVRALDFSLLMPVLTSASMKTIFEEDLIEDNFETTLLIFPLEMRVLHFFTIRGGELSSKKNLYLMLSALNFVDYGFIEISYRKCVV
jgi:hypothetical protein